MRRHALCAAPVAVALTVILRCSPAAADDAGPGPAAIVMVADAGTPAELDAGPGPGPTKPSLPGPGGIGTSPTQDAIDAIYKGVVDGNVFLAVGALLSILVMGARWGLSKKWPTFSSDPGGVVIVLGLAIIGGVGNAWMAGSLDSHTFVGVVKVAAAAVAAYGVPKKLLFGDPTPKTNLPVARVV